MIMGNTAIQKDTSISLIPFHRGAMRCEVDLGSVELDCSRIMQPKLRKNSEFESICPSTISSYQCLNGLLGVISVGQFALSPVVVTIFLAVRD